MSDEKFRELIPGRCASTSHNACLLSFSGGGPYDDKVGLFDHDQYVSIGVVADGVKYNYDKCGPREYRLKKGGAKK